MSATNATAAPFPLISVIVPVYNTQMYLCRCVESILAQSYTRLEVLLVDDASNDDSPRICDEFAEKDNRVRVLHQKHGGVSRARNTGAQAATGEYVVFVDSDDTIAATMIQELYDALVSAQAEVAICALRRVTSHEVPSHVSTGGKLCYYTGPQAMETMLYQKRFETGPCGKLYTRPIVLAHPFPEGRFFEDLFIMYKMLYDAKGVAFIPRKRYYYMDNPQSAMHRCFHEGVLDELYAVDEILHFVRGQCPQYTSAALARKYSAYCQVFRWMRKGNLTQEQERLRQQIWAYLTQQRWPMALDRNARWKNRFAALCTLLGRRFFLLI
ncbi:glycosyltransferase family 2 protein [Candidatus Allofournierella excrementavium]|uniref:glycosyltransferase family 2 protein n=1 Tax=Candidatus Allofournierella excrementavium TaxID=2838591 RepID=UPI00374E23FD